MDISKIALSLFFTKSMNLDSWAKEGSMQRELLIYNRLADYLNSVNFVTYGGKKDYQYRGQIGNINLCAVERHVTTVQNFLDLLVRHKDILRKSDIYKTHQIRGAEVPILAKKIYGKKLVVRCGYLLNFFAPRTTDNRFRREKAIRLEKRAFASADMGVVTSAWQREIVIKEYKIPAQKIKVIPNCIIPEVFRPIPHAEKEYDLVYVGRGAPQKNLMNLLEALNSLRLHGKNISFLMIGACSSKEEILKKVKEYSLNVEFKKNIPNTELPCYLNKARVFILPSYYEGHPKSLLEAMCCGLPCIGTDVDGIKQDIQHLQTGYLCKTDYESLAAAIENFLSDETILARTGRNAREYVIDNYSIDKVLKMELEMIEEVMSK